MPFTLNIIPHIPSLDMYGSAKTHTAYSLSGEIVLTLTSPQTNSQSLFFNPSTIQTAASLTPEYRPATIFLSSLLVTFEGKVELISSNCGYSATRLAQVSKELVTGDKPLILTNKGVRKIAKDDLNDGTMRWSMTFDLAIPGWLPPSSSVPDGSGTSYSLFASAKFAEDMESALSVMPATRASSSSTLSSYIPAPLLSLNPFSRTNRVKATSATPVPIKVNRFRSPKSLNPFMGTVDLVTPLVPPQIAHPIPSLFPVTLESVETRVNLPPGTDRSKRIPLEILSSIEIVAGVPEFISTSEDKIPLSLRIRSSNGEEINKGLVLEAFDVEVEQTEKFRSVPCERYITTFPVPPASEQPPNKPLLNPNPLEQFQNLGLAGESAAANGAVQWTRTVPMVSGKRVTFRPSPGTGGLEIDEEWAKMDLSVTVLRKSDTESEPETPEELEFELTEKGKKEKQERTGRNLRRTLLAPDFDTPLSRVRHDMKISLKLSWLPEEVAQEIDDLINIVEVTCGRANSGDKKRKLRMCHPERKTETLMLGLSVRMVEVSEQVQAVYKAGRSNVTANVGPMVIQGIRGAPYMRRTLARSGFPSRSASPAISEASSSASSQPSLTRSNSSSSASSPMSSCVGLPSRSNSPAPPAPSFHFALPPYSELYHANGERKESENSWLPKYEKEDTSSMATLMSPEEPHYAGPYVF